MSVVVEHKVQSSDDESSLEIADIESTNDEEGNHEDHNNAMTAKGSESLQKYQEEMEQRFTCPLTLDFMMFPIKAGDNQTYERYAILQWFFEHQTSPLTREPLDISLFRPEKELQLEIRTYLTTNNIEIPVLPNTGYSLWKRLVILRHMVNCQNSRYRHNLRAIESDINNISNENQMEQIRYQERNNIRNARSHGETNSSRSTRSPTSLRTRRDRRYPGGRASNNSDRDVDADVDAGVGVGVSENEGRGSRRDSRYRHAVYCERCRQDVFVLSFREYPFQTCRCGTLLTRIPPPNSSMGGERSSCIIS